jgi:hypothetical protein
VKKAESAIIIRHISGKKSPFLKLKKGVSTHETKMKSSKIYSLSGFGEIYGYMDDGEMIRIGGQATGRRHHFLLFFLSNPFLPGG